jgi:hypothetical protein
MRVRRTWLSPLAVGLLAAGLLALPGCLRFVRTICPPEPAQTAPCQGLPDCYRDHVYVFMLHGLDPFDCCNLLGVRDYVRFLGFCNTTYGQYFEACWFRKEICRIREADPYARFVVIGFSRGARAAHDMVNDLRGDGVVVSLLVYLDGKGLMYYTDPRLENVERTVNVRAPGFVWQSPCIDGAVNVNVPVWHFAAPTYPRVLEVLAQELTLVAANPPVVLPPHVIPAPAAPNPPPNH